MSINATFVQQRSIKKKAGEMNDLFTCLSLPQPPDDAGTFIN